VAERALKRGEKSAALAWLVDKEAAAARIRWRWPRVDNEVRSALLLANRNDLTTFFKTVYVYINSSSR
jgi:hypothetical protein